MISSFKSSVMSLRGHGSAPGSVLQPRGISSGLITIMCCICTDLVLELCGVYVRFKQALQQLPVLSLSLFLVCLFVCLFV